MRVAIIGAGSAGLAALRHCTANLDLSGRNSANKISEVVCYEKTDKIGGTWVYVSETGVDRYGLKIHSSMYDNLRTNLPKEVMGYPDFPIAEETQRSYLTRTEILNFLVSYCDNFKLQPYIKFLHHVELVEPNTDESSEKKKWKLRVKDLENDTVTEEMFDEVMICNGHYFEPSIPEMEGHDKFKGEQLHSHDYRTPNVFSNKSVVVIGAGPSGMDLALDISKYATKVILSHHLRDPINTVFPSNVVQKTDVVKLEENSAVFKDGSKERVDVVFYCTGYKYSFPFLSEKCGVKVDSNMVRPLWKHLLSTENPTLAFIGLPFYVCAFSMFDLQVRFVMAFWLNKKKLPNKEEMLAEERAELEEKEKKGLEKKHFHMMGPDQGRYYEDLAQTAGINSLPPVLTKLHNESSMRFLDDLVHYRDDRYKIVDDFNFVQL